VHFCGYGFLLICSNLGQKLKLEIRNLSILVFQRVSFSGGLLSALRPCARRHAVGGKRQAHCAVRRAFYETSFSL
jgi:hypothetical protein